ncbi:tyrosine phosphatase family-domain-containing protein [Tirmania nivea]|nr:tyrosine phosphatase family-domain-containing protein [Tirmania nivea]
MSSPPTPPHHDTHHSHVHHPTSCTTHTSAPPAPFPPSPIIPPLSFSMVAPNIYRSGYPLPINHSFLTLLRLRSIIYLSDKPPLPPTLTWASSQSPPIVIHHFPLPPVKEPFVENDPVGMKNALEVLLDKRNHPVLIHSNKGKHRAGVLVGCVRKLLMGWGLAATFAEYGRYAGEKGEADLEFIELFSPALTFDKRYAPEWLRVQYKEVEGPGGQGEREEEFHGAQGHICNDTYHADTPPPMEI